MKTTIVKLSDIRESEYNPRVKGIINSELIDSISKFGYIEPIVVNTREHEDFTGNERSWTIIGGHQRYNALLTTYGPEYTIDVVLVNFDKKTEKEANLALNKIKGEWDFDKLRVLLQEFKSYDIVPVGFDFGDVDKLLSSVSFSGSSGSSETKQPDKIKESVGVDSILNITFDTIESMQNVQSILNKIRKDMNLETIAEALVFVCSEYEKSRSK